MTAQRWQQVRDIFLRAAECDPSSRAAFVRESCGGDTELEQEVESLFNAEGDGTSVLRSPVEAAAAMATANRNGPESLTVLNGRYELERELGRGGMSVVYLARDRQLLSKHVVVKVLLDATQLDPWIRQKFQQEMEALARIDHPGVVGVLDSGLTPDGKRFLVMQYVEGATLRQAIDSGPLTLARAASLLLQVGKALGAAHDKGVWHRDLKPENIMLQRLGAEEHVKLIDFGIARIQDSQFGGEKTKVAGSLTYMAPEQFAGQPCAASDTYALAVVAYEMLTGKPPFWGDSLTHLVAEDKFRPVPPRDFRPELPEAAGRSILKAMSFRPELRHAGVREFAEELCQVLTGSEPAHRPPGAGTLEIGHVLFTDLVGYSLLPMDEQREQLEELQNAVRGTPQFRYSEASGELISLPTGDGMALVFFGDPTAPAKCALELAAALKSRPHLELRMGIHSGPVYRVADVNAKANVAGGGINIAQRVMDCGDAGHILVSRSTAEVLTQFSQWRPHLTDLGECTVKHGVVVRLSNLVQRDLGNPAMPRRMAAPVAAPVPRAGLNRTWLIAAALVLAVIVVGGGIWFWRSRGSGPPVDNTSIAVLPFADLSPEKNQEYFSDGLAEELLNALARTPGLRVVGRTSSFQFKGKTGDSAAIGKTLHAAMLLEGSVRRQDKRVRVAAQLIQASDGYQLWSDSFDGQMDDIFAVQNSIARAVTGALRLTLIDSKRPTIAKSVNTDAYNAYLQGRFFFERHNKESMFKAMSHFEHALQLDPGYPKAWVGLGESRAGLALAGHIPTDDGFKRGREAAEKALALDPNLAEAYSLLGWIKMYYDWDWPAADAAYKRALELDPRSPRAMSAACVLARILGRLDDAMALGRRTMDIDPVNPRVHHNAAMAFYYAGRQDDAVTAFTKALEIEPGIEMVHAMLSVVRLAQSQPAAALTEAQKEPQPAFRLFALALCYHALGQKRDADSSLADLINQFQKDAPYQIAQVYAFRGETGKAMDWLERAYQERDLGVSEAKAVPLLKNLANEPRHAAFLKKLRLTQ